MKLDHYQILGVPPNVSQKALRKAYKSLCQKYHPDKNEANAEHFARIRKAYDALSNPERRSIYDQGIKQGISPEEFSNVLNSMCVSIVMKTFERLSQRPEGNFLREAHRALSTEKADIAMKEGEIRERYDLVMRHVESIKEGKDTLLVKTVIRKAGEFRAALKSCEVALAVLQYLMEDTARIVCPDTTNVEARLNRLLGGTVTFT